MTKKIRVVPFLFLTLTAILFYAFKSIEPSESENLYSRAFVVLELFTSQGCSSCPPADILLDEVKNKYPDRVFALSYHVDYWNYIGWKDPFSQSKFSSKQSFYNVKLKSRSNYTPQVVVNGTEHFVGSNRLKIYAAIETKENINNTVRLLKAKRANGKISFDYSFSGSGKGELLRAVLVVNQRITNVSRGENRNRTLKNTNIVVSEKYLNHDSGVGAASIDMPDLVRDGDELTLMLISETDDMSITGADKKVII